MLKQNQESQSLAGVRISEGCERHFQYINMEGKVSKMWAPLHGVGNRVTGQGSGGGILIAAFASGFNWRGLCSALWAQSGQ